MYTGSGITNFTYSIIKVKNTHADFNIQYQLSAKSICQSKLYAQTCIFECLASKLYQSIFPTPAFKPEIGKIGH